MQAIRALPGKVLRSSWSPGPPSFRLFTPLGYLTYESLLLCSTCCSPLRESRINASEFKSLVSRSTLRFQFARRAIQFE